MHILSTNIWSKYTKSLDYDDLIYNTNENHNDKPRKYCSTVSSFTQHRMKYSKYQHAKWHNNYTPTNMSQNKIIYNIRSLRYNRIKSCCCNIKTITAEVKTCCNIFIWHIYKRKIKVHKYEDSWAIRFHQTCLIRWYM